MTNKEAKNILYKQWQEFLENNVDYVGVSEAYKMSFKALDNYDIINKIKLEINEIVENEVKVDKKWALGLRYSLKIIDKYIGEE